MNRSTIHSLLFATIATGALVGTVAPRADAQGRSRLDTTFAFSKSGTVELGLISGEITVTGWNRSEIKIVAFTRRGTIETSLSNSRVTLSLRGQRNGNWDSESRYELMVPVGTRVTANSVSGDITVKSTGGETEISTVSGEVQLVDAADRISINTVSGDVHATKLRGRTRVEGVSSGLVLEDVTGDVNAKAVSGDIALRNINSSNVRAETVSGDIAYEGAVSSTGTYEFNAHSGDVRLAIPVNTNAQLSLQTWSGEINSQFPMTMQTEDRGRRSKRMSFTIGSGAGAHISAETFSGDITIERAGRSSKEN
jgi:DUF4097 and DUF4098 domain-containing protein YvlB